MDQKFSAESLNIRLQRKGLVLKSPFQNDCEVLRKIWPCDENYLMVRDDPMKSVFLDDHNFFESFSRSLKKGNYRLVFKQAEVIVLNFSAVLILPIKVQDIPQEFTTKELLLFMKIMASLKKVC